MGDVDADADAGTVMALIFFGLVLVAVISAAVTTARNGAGPPEVASTTKAVEAICSPTQYKDTCQDSLSDANTTDPRKLIETAIGVAVGSIRDVLTSTSVLQEAANDPMTRGAFAVCGDVLEKAAGDLRRSVGKVDAFDPARAGEYVADLRTWLSAVVANQETCVDAFENTTGGVGERMRKLLKNARELSSNGLAMVTDLSEFVGGGGGGREVAVEEGDEFVGRRLTATVSLEPTIVVAKDGSGQFKTINDAIASLPKENNDSFIVIHIKAGVYNENVDIPKGLNKIVLVGDGPTATRLTGKRSMAGGHQTYYTATLATNGDDFLAKDLAVENTAGPEGYQALAVRVSGDRSILYNVHMDGYQDTLCADIYRQYYRNCTITGTIDYVFGNSVALFQDCTFVTRKPGPSQECVVTAQGRFDLKSNSAIIIQNGRFIAEQAFLDVKPKIASYLGRPWKELSTTIIMQSDIGGFIEPEGWAPWIGAYGLDTCYYVEYENRGPGANRTGRVTWKGIQSLKAEQINRWTGGVVFGDDAWIKDSGVPYVPTMMQVKRH
ncbi:pectinesterase-like [Salvia miltiorrhiza]|uniref:pectinesterase-like n=1 Tax=Salvia miltiorrhiza TaxID=226208 RepID=UPI0025ABE1FD|nr:pectinesterase-like [Salvia miltiorrhiza]